MPRHMLPQVGTPVWFFADPTRRPQAAIVTKRVAYNSFNLSVLKPADGTVTGTINVPFLENPALKPASGQYCTPTGIQDDIDGAGDTTTLSQKAVSAVVTAGGANYAVGDTITVANGVVARVATLATTAAATVTIVNGGNVTKPGPVPAQSQISSSGAGTGATLTITWADN